jgi:N-acyl-L-homoserine lactone synthetase
MLHIIDQTNRAGFTDELQAMFADRKRVFIDRLGWDLPITDTMFEIDQFDNAYAVYVVEVDESNNHLGSLRLLRTDGPHILSTLFPQLCEDGVPQGVGLREITRLCISPSAPRHHRRAIRDRLISAMVDHALLAGISSFTGVVTAHFLDQILMMGWDCDQLGKRMKLCGLELGAFCAHIYANTPHKLARTGIYFSDGLKAARRAQSAPTMMGSA